ncbi:hypothetical protein N9E66_05090 [Gammaproteobacteria bacterium]|nr:hypothetical protein [Gammaproteobacteria bacterium]
MIMVTQTFHNLVYRSLGAAIGLFTYSFISKNQSAEAFAELVVIQAVSMLFVAFCHFGQPLALLKMISGNGTNENQFKRNEIFTVSCLICLSIVFLASILVFTLNEYFAGLLNTKSENLYILFLIILFKVLQILMQEFFRSINNFRIFNIMQVLPQTLFIVLLIANKSFYENVFELINIYLTSIIFLVIFASFALAANGFKPILSKNKLFHAYALMPLGYAFFLVTVFDVFSMEYSFIYLSSKVDPLTIACYAISLKLLMFLSMGVKALNSVTKPQISNLYSNNKINELKKLSKNYILFGISFYSISMFIFYMFGEMFIDYAFDFDPQLITKLFLLLSITVFINAITGPIGSIMEMCDLHIVYRNISAAGAILFLIFAILLINSIGIIGIIIALLIYELFINCSSWGYIILKKKIFFTS